MLSAALAPCALRAQDEPAALPTITVEGQQIALHPSGVVIRVPVDALGAPDLAELLASLPGVQVRSSGGLGSYSEASLRGSSGRQVRLLLDGLPLDPGGGDATSLSLVSTSMLDQVEIYKGRVPIDLGSGLAGTINLRSRRTLAAPVVGSASLGSFGQRQLSSAAQLSDTVQLSAGTQSADNDYDYVNEFRAFDPNDPDRRGEEARQNAGTEQHFALLRYQGAARISAQALEDRQELPTRANFENGGAELNTQTHALSLATPEDARWQTVLSHRFTREQFIDRDSELGLGTQDSQDDTHRSLLRVSRQFDSLQTASTLDYTDYQSEDHLERVATSSARRLGIGQGFEYQTGPRLPLGIDGNLSLNANWSREDSDQQHESQWVLEPAIGASKRIGLCVATTNLGQRERLPTFFERYGDRGLFKGNPSLKSESANFADAGVRCTPGEVVQRVELTFFGQDLRDAISPTFNAQGVGRSVNTAKAQIAGFEFSAAAAWAGFDGQIGSTWQHTEDRSEVRATRGQQLPGRFETQVNTRIARRWRGLTFHYAFRYEAGQFYDSTNLLEAEPLRRHDVGVRGAVRQLGWSMQALNLRDDNAEQFNGFPTPGRHLLLSLTYPQSSPQE
ncbi:MAG: TonB-dependent receptor plug domain-containing protein [Panacagrimonas sp.]